MAEKKSILEEALLDAEKIQKTLDANTREILRSVAKEEIDGLVKESLLAEDDFTEDDFTTDDEAGVATPDAAPESGVEPEADAAPEMGSATVGDETAAVDDSPEVGPEMGQELGMDADALGGDDMDLTAASDDDVIAIYKKLSGEDEIEIVGDDIHLTVDEPGEYVIKGAGAGAVGGEEDDMGDEFSDDDLEEVPTGAETSGSEDDDVDYEISLDSEEGGAEPEAETAEGGEDTEGPATDATPESDEDDTEIDEQISVNRVGQNRAGGDLTDIKGPGAQQGAKLSESVQKKQIITEAKYNTLLAESTKLKTENEEFRKALKKFRNMLVETVVFNSNLSYVTKLFMEHSTTKDEKKTIINRFDEEVSNLKESKKLYKTIANELAVRKPLTESIDKKIIQEVTTGASKQLNESTAYVDPSTQKIRDLIQRVEKR